MFDRWGWFAAAFLAASLVGCAGEETQEDGAPPEETATAGEGGGTAGESGMEAGGTAGEGMTGGGEAATGGGEAGAPPVAAPAGPVTLDATWMGEGAGRKVAVKAGTEEVAQMDPGQMSDQVMSYLKSKRETMVAAGETPKVTIMVPVDMPFDQVGQPLMKSAFKAGFRASEVEYKPGGK